MHGAPHPRQDSGGTSTPPKPGRRHLPLRRLLAATAGILPALLLALAHPIVAAAAGPVLTEFLAANENGLRDADGDRSDWIELFNPTTTTVPLEGWYLTDDPRRLDLWRFPAISLPPQGFLVVFASGKNRSTAGAELHTNFQLGRDGEFLALVEPDGQTLASLYPRPYPRHVRDVSYGLPMVASLETLVADQAALRFRELLPGQPLSPANWTLTDFDDTSWSTGSFGIGYQMTDAASPEGPEPVPDPEDVTRPDDFIVPTSPNSPGNEGVTCAIDGNTATKYLNFDKLNAGFTVTPSLGPTLVTGLRLTTANDAPERDPTSFLLSGSNDGKTFTQIATGSVSLPTTRFTAVTLRFPNTNSWLHYRLLFPTVRNAAAAVAMQIAEVEFLGQTGADQPTFAELIHSPVEDRLRGRASGLMVRVPFQAGDLSTPASLTLRLRYEDGFVAYLNGVEVARANVPASLTATSLAVTNRLRSDATRERVLDLSAHAGLLRPGTNILALLGLNSRIDSGDFLLEARLERARYVLGQPGHLPDPTPGAPNPEFAGGLVEDITVDPPRGFRSTPFDLTLACPTPGAMVRYTTNGATPSPTNGIAYTGPIRIGQTTTLRTAAFRDQWRPSPVVTHTYLFPADILSQSQTGTVARGFPAVWLSATSDYGLDRRVVGTGGTDAFGGRYVADFTNQLQALPTISLVLPIDAMFGPLGIYANPDGRGSAWERPVSFEWMPSDGTPAFQVDAGVRIQGGAFRSFGLSKKKSFRIVFRGDYGPSRLEQPIFGPDAATWFDNFILRANSNDAWPYGDTRAVYARDTFAMNLARDLGIASSHSRFAHLYINGLYWGLYNPVERPDASFSEAYLGGAKDSWDSINQDSVPDGDDGAWRRLLSQTAGDLTSTANYQRVQGNNPDGTRNPALENLVDVDNYINYLLLNFYMGNVDWPHRNWWAGRRREGPDAAGFQFRPWDTETSLDFSGLDADVTGASEGAARPYVGLRRNADFRMRFADHAFRHFSPGGPLYVNAARPQWDPAQPENNRPAARFAAAAAAARPGIVGESARWGDQLGSTLRTRDQHWQPEVDRLLTQYFPQRSTRVITQLRRAGLYPSFDPPSASLAGGSVPRGSALVLTPTRGSVIYTLDGSDPRGPGGVSLGTPYSGPIVIRQGVRILARSVNQGEWSALRELTFSVTEPTQTDLGLSAQPDAAGQIRLRFLGRAGSGYTVYQSTTLAPDNWSVFHSGLARPADGPVELLIDTTTTGPRYFRVSIP